MKIIKTIPIKQMPAALNIWQQRATRAIFFVAGFGIAAWAPLIPFVKLRLGITEAMLGVLLLCIGIGSVLTLPVAGVVAARSGCQRILTITGVALPVLLVLLSILDSLPLIILVLLLLGSTMGMMNAVMNIHAVLVEQASGQRLMSGMHAMWSIGGFAGAGLFGVLMQFGLSPLMAMGCIAVIIWSIIAIFCRHLLTHGGVRDGSPLAIPKGIVGLIGVLCFISFLAEGAVLDWSGVFLTAVRGMDLELAGSGYAVFSIAMLAARLFGDSIVQKFGGRRIVIGGGVIAAIGFGLTMVLEDPKLSLLGFFCVGIGSANIVPVLFSLLGKQTVMPVNMAVAAVTTIAQAGILLGPAAIGFIAQQTDLISAFGLLAGLLIVQAVLARYVYATMR